MSSFYFENMEEMIAYVQQYKPGEDVSWASGTEYLDRFKKGYLLFDQGRFSDAIVALKKALEVNPVGLSARFEIVECHMQMGEYAQAKQDLIEIAKFAIRDTDKARFFRRYGFIATEEGNYKLAFSCFTYSLNFEQNASVSNELMYIASKARINFKKVDVKQEIRSEGLPLFADDVEALQNEAANDALNENTESESTKQKKGIFSSFINKYIK